MSKSYSAPRFFFVALGAALLAMCALAIAAQSGRRTRKPEAQSAPTPEATPTPKPAEKAKPSVVFLVGLDKYGDFSRISLSDYSGVLRSCAERLNESRSVKADTAQRDMGRADAIRQAKSEKETYVVWLQLRPNTVSARTGVYDDPYNVYVEYTVFAPITGKQETSGNTYPEAYRRTTVRIPSSPTVGDYYLNQAARGAADRILDHFHVRTGTTFP
jgi:hypothetical protein